MTPSLKDGTRENYALTGNFQIQVRILNRESERQLLSFQSFTERVITSSAFGIALPLHTSVGLGRF